MLFSPTTMAFLFQCVIIRIEVVGFGHIILGKNHLVFCFYFKANIIKKCHFNKPSH